MKRFNEWARQHPWQAAAATALFLFVVGTVFGIVAFDRGLAVEAARAAVFAGTFSLLTGALNSYRRRRDGN